MANIVQVNGQRYEFPDGTSISIVNNQIFANGVPFDGNIPPNFEIRLSGSFHDVSADGSITVSGEIKGNVQAGGSVNCDDIGGNVSAGGSVNCDDIGGNVSAGGSVRADEIRGKVIGV